MKSVLTYTKIVNLPIVAMSTRGCWEPHRTKLRMLIPRKTAPSTIPPKDQHSALHFLSPFPPQYPSRNGLDRLPKVNQSMGLLMA